MKTKINFLILSILFSSSIFGHTFINNTNYPISIVCTNGEIQMIEPKKQIDIKNNLAKNAEGILQIQINEKKININLLEDCSNVIYFKEKNDKIIAYDTFGTEDEPFATISLEDEEEELEDSNSKKASLFTFKNIAIVGIIGTFGYLAWDYYKKSQEKQQK